jgi:predicted permease
MTTLANSARWFDALRADLRFAGRYFGRNKLTVAIIVSVFALGIGANAALVTVIQSQVQRPAPAVPDDAQVRIWGEERRTPAARWNPRSFSYAEFQELAARRETFTDVAAWLAHDVILDSGDSTGPLGVGAHFVTQKYFATLGVGIAAGNEFPMTEDGVADMSAVMSFDMAVRLFGTPAAAVGTRILVNEVPIHVVGVAPRGFQGALRNMDRPALWIPVSARADIARVPSRWLTERAILEVFGRVAKGVSPERAANTAQLVLSRTLPDSAGRVGMARRAQILSLHAMEPGERSQELIVTFGILGFAGIVLLLITCTNVSSLMVAAAAARRHEIAVRLSLGASRGRVLRQLLTETTVLAVAGAATGLLVCWWLLMWVSGGRGNVQGNMIAPDVYTVAWTMAIALGTGIVFGLSPALHAIRGGVAHALRDSGTGASRRSRLQRGFVVAQIVFSQPLLVMLGVMLAMIGAEYRPLGKELSERLTSVTFRPLSATGAPGQRREAVDSLIPRIAAHPEVTGVVAEASWMTTRGFLVSGRDSSSPAANAPTTILVYGAAPGWFALQDIPILLGRDVAFADTAERDWPVVVGNDLARTLWGETSPIGRTMTAPGEDSIRMIVVGVYNAAQPMTVGSQEQKVFTAHGKEWRRDAILVRTRGPAEAFTPELWQLIRNAAPGLPVTRMRTLALGDAEERRTRFMISGLVGAGGALALLLASLGLYGVIALAVRQRTREIGIRIALGAKPVRVARMFLGSGVRLGVVGLAIGLPLTMLLLRLLLSNAELLAPKVNQWAIGVGIAATLLAVAAAATWVPAQRAARIDPSSTLRTE